MARRIQLCEETLSWLEPKDNPFLWAYLQNDIGRSLLENPLGDRSENLETAIACSQEALKVYTFDAFPQGYGRSWSNLGIFYKQASQWQEAYHAFDNAIDTVESIREAIVVGGASDKQKLAEDFNELYLAMVKVCLELGYLDRAIEYVERSKARNLAELIFTRDLSSIFPPEIVSQLEKLRDEIASGQYQLQTAIAENPTTLAQHLQQLREQRNELQNRYFSIGSSFKFDQFQAILDEQTAIIEWYITSTSCKTFIITRHSLQRLKLSNPTENLQTLKDWDKEYRNAYSLAIKTQWRNSLTSRLSRLAEILHLEDILKLVPENCSLLHLFPLHALPLANGELLCDRFPQGVGYAPSCQLLQLSQKQHRPDFSHLFAVQDPTNNLTFANLEVEAIRSYFPSAEVLPKQDSTEAALKLNQNLPLAHCFHFSCHGEFKGESPLDSALLLAQDDSSEDGRLTLAEIFGLSLSQCRLVTLSACETGITDPNSISDEYIGLPSGFLYAGSATVVSSLWEVNSLSTSFLTYIPQVPQQRK